MLLDYCLAYSSATDGKQWSTIVLINHIMSMSVDVMDENVAYILT